MEQGSALHSQQQPPLLYGPGPAGPPQNCTHATQHMLCPAVCPPSAPGPQPLQGTSTAIEKSYFRLTSAPDPSTVRPEPVIAQALQARPLPPGATNPFPSWARRGWPPAFAAFGRPCLLPSGRLAPHQPWSPGHPFLPCLLAGLHAGLELPLRLSFSGGPGRLAQQQHRPLPLPAPPCWEPSSWSLLAQAGLGSVCW